MYYCCISDFNYSHKVLTLNNSLSKIVKNHTLIVYCLDDKIFNFLNICNFNTITPIKIKEIDNDKFFASRQNRSWIEFIWTATPIIIYDCLIRFKKDVVYVDSDLFFYNDPKILLKESSKYDVMISPHNFSKDNLHLEKFGKYCVQFNYFNTSENAKNLLKIWSNQCIEWCYDKYENGKFGDQKYLDEWPKKYGSFVGVINHKGILAPWNLNNFNVVDNLLHNNDKVVEPIFYHFHDLNFISKSRVDIGNYKISDFMFNKFYLNYIKILKEMYLKANDYSKINIYRDKRNIKKFIKRLFKLTNTQIKKI